MTQATKMLLEEVVKMLEACPVGKEPAPVDKCTVVSKEPPQKQAKTDWHLIGVADNPTNCKMYAEKERES